MKITFILRKNLIIVPMLLLLGSCCKIKNCAYTEGVIVDGRYYKKQYYYYDYTVDDKKYTNQEGCYLVGVVKGEYYTVCYDSIDPSISKLYFDQPVKLDRFYNYRNATGSITKVFKTSVQFEYEVGGRSYKRQQFINSQQYLQGEKCVVSYRENNPSIGYLK